MSGFDETPTAPVALDAVRLALERVEAVAGGLAEAERGEDWAAEAGDPEAAIGDLLFAVVALARRLRVNPEEALRTRSMGFATRFRALEARAREDGVDLHDLDDARMARALGGDSVLTAVPCQIRRLGRILSRHPASHRPIRLTQRREEDRTIRPTPRPTIDSPITLRRIAVVLIAGICGLVAFAVYGQVAQSRHLDAQVSALAAQNSALDAADLGSGARDRRRADRRLARAAGAAARLHLPGRTPLRDRSAGTALGVDRRRVSAHSDLQTAATPTPTPSRDSEAERIAQPHSQPRPDAHSDPHAGAALIAVRAEEGNATCGIL